MKAYTQYFSGDYIADFKNTDAVVDEKLDYIKELEDDYFDKVLNCEESERQLEKAQSSLTKRLE